MSEKGMNALEAIAQSYSNLIEQVVIGEDKNIAEDYSHAIATFCIKNDIPYIRRQEFTATKAEYVIAISWRWLIPHDEKKLIVFHDSLLPRYRGFAPLVNMLIQGEKRIGVTALLGAANYDSGDILHQSSSEISYPITIQQAITTITQNYRECVLVVFAALAQGSLPYPIPQDYSQASYSLWRDEEDYFINWNQSAKDIRRFIDAVGYPYAGAASMLNGKKVRVLSAEEMDDVAIEIRQAGKVIFTHSGLPIVVCGKGLLKITQCYADNTNESVLPLDKFRSRFGV